jgi:hypothetical protein
MYGYDRSRLADQGAQIPNTAHDLNSNAFGFPAAKGLSLAMS